MKKSGCQRLTAMGIAFVFLTLSACGQSGTAGSSASAIKTDDTKTVNTSSESTTASSGSKTASSGIKKYAGTTLHMIAEQSSPTEAMEAQLDKFYDLTGIKLELEKAPYDDVVQKETLAFEGKTGAYDIVAAPYEFLGNLVENKYIQPIEPFMQDSSLAVIPEFKTDDIIKNLWNASSNWKDKLYGIPANSCSMFMAYRKDYFENEEEKKKFKEKYGYDLAVPTNWDQYRDMAEFFTRKAGDTLAGTTLQSDCYGVSMSGKRHTATTCEWLNYLWSFGGDIFDEKGNVSINSSKAVDSLQYYVDLTKFAPPGVTSKTWDEQVTEMQQGIAAMAIMFNDGTPAVEDPSASAVVGKMGYAAIPVKEKKASFYGGWGYYIPTDSKNAEAAWVFLEWFNTPEVQRGIAAKGCLPNLSSLYSDPELSKIPYWKASMDAYEICSKKPRIPEWNNMSNSMQLQLSNAITGENTPKEALDNLANDYTNNVLAGKLPVTYQ